MSIPWFAEDFSVDMSTAEDYLALSPKEIGRRLEKSVIDQTEACKSVAVMMYMHLRGHRSVNLLAGPTGSGKSFIAETLKEIFPEVVYIRDISNVTCDGFSGTKKAHSVLSDTEPVMMSGRLIYPFIFLDECDKMFSPRITSSGENVSESVQHEFLTMIHGGDILVPVPGDKTRTNTVNTENYSFLFAGAFEKTANNIAKDESGPSIGFNADQNGVSPYDRCLTIDDIRAAGCIAELCGRIDRVIPLNRFSEEEYRKVLDIKNKGPIHEMEIEYDISIHISKEKKDELAHNAYKTGLGIRKIKKDIKEYIYDLMWKDCDAKELDIS